MIRVGVIGYGYWGPNIVRNFNMIDGAEVAAICDKNPLSAQRARKNYPNLLITENSAEIVQSPDIDLVTVITPVSTHYELAKQALLNGKHVFVEKPFTSNTKQAAELIEIAGKKNLKIMVDHTFLFTSAVRKIKQIIEDDVLGELYYYDSTRVNLGLFQHDVNVIWDLAPHDFSIMDYLIKEKPDAVAASGKAHINSKEDIAYIMVYFSKNIIAHLNVNWLSPVKLRTTLIGGEKKMLMWNDVDADEKIKVYDRGVEITNSEGIYNLLVNYRSGDMWAPKVDQIEALKLETQYFVDCINKNEEPFNNGHAGLRVVRMLEACDESLKNNGRMVKL
ncbi:MAG: Gfo/Idh/MocA family oxidoreductase [Deltaproteobacteria bacterium]|nr:Gfo/Idh/MocA family oxidoreductase [Deltaproteobacteria bacterium]